MGSGCVANVREGCRKKRIAESCSFYLVPVDVLTASPAAVVQPLCVPEGVLRVEALRLLCDLRTTAAQRPLPLVCG